MEVAESTLQLCKILNVLKIYITYVNHMHCPEFIYLPTINSLQISLKCVVLFFLYQLHLDLGQWLSWSEYYSIFLLGLVLYILQQATSLIPCSSVLTTTPLFQQSIPLPLFHCFSHFTKQLYHSSDYRNYDLMYSEPTFTSVR